MENIPYAITFICMEPSRPPMLAEIAARINAEPTLPVRIHLHAHESGRVVESRHYETICSQIRASDLVIVQHVMLNEEVELLQKAICEHARPGTSVLAISSAAPLMRLTRVGRFRMRGGGHREKSPPTTREAGASPSPLRRLLKRIASDTDIASHLRDMMILAPRILRFIPGSMQDLKSYVEAYLYSIELSGENIRSMFLMLADRYHPPVRGKLAGCYRPPAIYPAEGIYHPDAPSLFDARHDYLEWYHGRKHVAAGRPMIGLLLLRGNVISGETGYIDSVIRAFEQRGIGVIAAFSGSFDYRVAVERMMLDRGLRGIEALVSLTGFPFVGGHVRSDTASSVAALERYGIPYFSPVSLLFQTTDEWNNSGYGLGPVQTALHVALPELDGAIEPLVVSGITEGRESGKTKEGIEDRTEKMVRRVERWLALRSGANADKRIAITLFAFPPNRGAVGTAAYLDVFRSLFNTLVRLRLEGYSIDLPDSPEQIIEHLIQGKEKLAPAGSTEITVGGVLEVEEYHQMAEVPASRVATVWGPAPGGLNSDGRRLHIYGVRYGNVFVGVQPSFGFEGDPMRLLFAKGMTPHHGFLAYYTWIERSFRADAHLHFGTHGALEFMPGKQVGLGSDCWPDILIGDLPNIYLYAVNNPSEGTIAKRRALATLVSYLTPPLEHAGLYRDLVMLKGLIADYHLAPPSDPKRELILETLVEKVDELHLEKDVPLPKGETGQEKFIARLESHLHEIESRLIPSGLHIVGESPQREEMIDLLLAAGEYDRPEANVAGITDIVAGALGVGYQDIYRSAESGDPGAVEQYRRIKEIARNGIAALLETGEKSSEQRIQAAINSIRTALSPARPDRERLLGSLRFLNALAGRAVEERELDSLMRGLSGGYIPPSVGGDPVRNPEALPSGRNTHALDPSSVPSAVALRSARRVVDLMLAKSIEETGSYPESIGMVLWGLDNIKTQGEAIAQAFVLIGVDPVADSIGRISRLKLVPLAELGRPRIDVTIQASGICRDIFGLQLELLDEAIRLVAGLDEPAQSNHVARRTGEIASTLGISHDDASIRIFSNSAGAYGTNIDYMVGMSAWKSREDLANVFSRRKSFAYGKRFSSVEAGNVFAELASGIDTTFQNLDSSEIGITDVDHYFEYLGGLTNVVEQCRGKRPVALVADTTTARAKVRTLEATIRLEARSKILNPRWYEGMLRHGYQGVEEIRKRLDYTFGFSATALAVDSWVYESVHAIYVDDGEMRERMTTLNQYAYAGIARRLVEAHDRGFWKTSLEKIEGLRDLCNTLDDQLEGIA